MKITELKEMLEKAENREGDIEVNIVHKGKTLQIDTFNLDPDDNTLNIIPYLD